MTGEDGYWRSMDDLSASGYSSVDDQMFSTPKALPAPSPRRNSTSATQPKPILKRRNSNARSNGMPRSRRVSFEDELDLGDEGISMFTAVPDDVIAKYRFR